MPGVKRKKPLQKNRGTAIIGAKGRQKLFLEALRISRTLSGASESTGIAATTHYAWLQKYPEYKDEFNQTVEDIAQELEGEAIRRAVDGWDEPVYQQGACIGYKRKFSDTLLVFMLKGMRPETYRERAPETEKSILPSITIYLPDNGRDAANVNGTTCQTIEGQIIEAGSDQSPTD